MVLNGICLFMKFVELHVIFGSFMQSCLILIDDSFNYLKRSIQKSLFCKSKGSFEGGF